MAQDIIPVVINGSLANQLAVNEDGSINVVASGIEVASVTVTNVTTEGKKNDITLQNAAVATGVGTPYTLQGEKTILIEIYGTSTSRTISFEGIGPSGTARQIMGVRLSDFVTALTTTGTGEFWQFDVTGLTSFQANLTAVAGGSVTVKGRAVA